MPASAFHLVDKGPGLRLLDQQFGGDEADYLAVYDDALAVLEGRSPQSLAELAAEHADESSGRVTGLSDDDVDHFRADWLGGWWPDQPVEEILRAGYADAIRRARDARLPIESLWVRGADAVAVYVVVGHRQVTVLVCTPPVPDAGGSGEPDQIWVARAGADGNVAVEPVDGPRTT